MIRAVAIAVLLGIVSTGHATAESGDWNNPAAAGATGISGQGLAFGGTFTIMNVALDPAGRLLANGNLNGALMAPGSLQTPVHIQTTLPVDLGQTNANCSMLNLAVGPADPSPAVHLDQTVLNVTLADGPGSRLRVPLCTITDVIRRPGGADNAEVAAVLNGILDLLKAAGTRPQ